MLFDSLANLRDLSNGQLILFTSALLLLAWLVVRRRHWMKKREAEEALEMADAAAPDLHAMLAAGGGQLTLEPWMTSPEVRAVFAALTKDGKEARFVGGCVRDALLHRPIGDIDIATQETPERVIELLETSGLKAVPTGIEHGTITAVVGGKTFEVTTLRRDVSTDGRRATVAFTDDWRMDAQRRDFTFNAMSAEPSGKVHDYFNGLQDLAHRQIRFIGRAEERILEDRLRILRYFRFIATLGMRIADRFEFQMVVKHRESLRELSAERVRDELMKIFASANQFDAVRMMHEEGIFEVVLPEATNVSWFRRLAWLDTSAVKIAAVKPDAVRRLASLIETDGDGAEAVGRRLKLSRAQIERLRRLKAPEWTPRPDASEGELRAALQQYGVEYVVDLTLLAWSRRLILEPRLPKRETEGWKRILSAAGDWEPVEFPLKGRDVLALGVEPGPRISELLDAVEAWWRAGGCRADRAACLTELRARLKH